MSDSLPRMGKLAPDEKRRLLAQLLREKAGRSMPLPLSFSQQRIWFQHQLEPASAAYNVPGAVHLSGSLDLHVLKRCLSEIVRRHEILRTNFVKIDEQPAQLIAPHAPRALPFVDLSALMQPQRETACRTLIDDEAKRPFNLAEDALLRTMLVRMDEREHVLLVTMHHIVSDAWSKSVFINEMIALYEAFAGGRPSPLPDLPIQYADFAAWQRRRLQSGELDAQAAYWKERLAERPASPFPTDYARGGVQSSRGETRFIEFSSLLRESLKELSQRENATLFMTLLAAFKVMLHTYSGVEDVIVGTDVASRTRAEVEGLIGFFVNQIVLRTDLAGDPTFGELLARVRATALSAYAHQDLPFDKLVEMLKPERDPATNPLFQVMFGFQSVPAPTFKLHGLTLRELIVSNDTAIFDLSLYMMETPGGLAGAMRYNTELYKHDTIELMLARFETILKAVVTSPNITLKELQKILDKADRRRQAEQQKKLLSLSREKLKNITPRPISGRLGHGARSVSNESEKQHGERQLGAMKPVESNPARGLLKFEGPVKAETLSGEQLLPLIVEPIVGGLDLAAWAQNNREIIEAKLIEHGAILFRGFKVKSALGFEQFVKSAGSEPMPYRERSSPRSHVSGNVYTSTDYPSDQSIFPHNEHSYSRTFPLRLYFYCQTPAQQAGQTPLVDCRKVLQRLDPQIKARFIEKRWMFVRNYGGGFGLDWQTVFQTSDAAAVESYCRQAGIECEWKSGNRLRTRQVRPVVAKHPRTGELVWFNHATFFHVTTLEPGVQAAMRAGFSEEDLPNNTFYGDGSPIEPQVLDHLREAYRQEMVSFEWRAGDIVMIDNMLTAHARAPFAGPRKVLFTMADPYTRTDF